MRSTIKDVARLANVSTATVSNVLTNKKYVSQELKDKIQAAKEKLGYEPNIIARSLKVNKTFKIGVVVPDITNPFFSEIVKYIEANLDKSEYQLILCNSDDKLDKELKIFESFLLGLVDGIILVAPRMNEKQMNRGYSIPIVILDRPAFDTESNITFIHADNYKGAELVADYFIKKEYHDFICITGPDDVPNANSRLNGFKQALVSKGIKASKIEEYRAEFNFDSCYTKMTQILKDYNPLKKKGVFVCSDIGAWGAIEAVKHKGLKIPRDIGIVGFDDIYFSKFIYPGLTTVQNPTEELGQTAAQMILDQLKGRECIDERVIVFEVTLVERNTV